MKLLNITYFLQIETVGPEGEKVIWVLLFIAIILTSFLLIRGRKKFSFPSFSDGVKVAVSKNKIYHPTIIHLKIINKSKKDVNIEHPILRFKKFRKSKAFKIKSVNSTKVYPMYLEANKTYDLAVALQNFYDYDKTLKRYSRLRIEFRYNQNKFKGSKYLLLLPTLFRKAKK